MKKNNQLFVEFLLRQDRVTAAELYNYIIPRARLIAYSYSRNEEDAKDIAHDAFEKFLRRLSKIQADNVAETNWEGYFITIVKNRAKDFLRKKLPEFMESEKLERIDQYTAIGPRIDEKLFLLQSKN